MISEWKMWQQMYDALVKEHTDARELHPRVYKPFDVEDALNYVREQGEVGVYPAKSYMVAIIYAVMIENTYGDPIRQTLDDPDLFLGQDDDFVRYSENKFTYDYLLDQLAKIPNWIEGGWAPKTVEYFHAECTQEGYEKLAAQYAA